MLDRINDTALSMKGIIMRPHLILQKYIANKKAVSASAVTAGDNINRYGTKTFRSHLNALDASKQLVDAPANLNDADTANSRHLKKQIV